MFLRLDFENYQNDNCVFEYGEIDSWFASFNLNKCSCTGPHKHLTMVKDTSVKVIRILIGVVCYVFFCMNMHHHLYTE